MAALWFYTQNGQKATVPVPLARLQALTASGALQPTDLVWREGMPRWVEAGTIPELFPGGGTAHLPPLPGSAPGQPNSPVHVSNLPPQPGTYPPGPGWYRGGTPGYPVGGGFPGPSGRRPASGPGKVKKIIGGVVGGLVILGLVILGIVTSRQEASETKQALNFNEKIVEGDKRLATAFKELEIAYLPFQNGLQADLMPVKRAFHKLQQEMAAIKSELATLPIPSKVSARALFEEYKRYLNALQDVIDCRGKIISIQEDTTLTFEEKVTRCRPFQGQLEEKGPKALQAAGNLKTAQQNFAKDYKITLTYPPGSP